MLRTDCFFFMEDSPQYADTIRMLVALIFQSFATNIFRKQNLEYLGGEAIVLHLVGLPEAPRFCT